MKTNLSRPILETLNEQQRADLLARVERVVDRSGGPDACHPYVGRALQRGYGVTWTHQPDSRRRRLVKVHRVVFEAATGESPPTVDHLCHDAAECSGLGEACPHRRCCNPAHMRGETVADNARRNRLMVFRDRCGRGHAMTPENTYESESGDRTCRKCAAENARNAREKARAERPVRPRLRTYRPRGMSVEQLVEWGLDGQTGDGCWRWRDAWVDAHGYVRVPIGGRNIAAHRIVYEVLVGPVSPGYVVDHTCHDPAICAGGLTCPHRQCVNPAHLTAVPNGENTGAERSRRARPDQCVHGHAFTDENTYADKRGSRHCRTCTRERLAQSRAQASGPDARLRADGLCRNGHDVAAAGLTKTGRCRECARQRNREYKSRQKGATLVSPDV